MINNKDLYFLYILYTIKNKKLLVLYKNINIIFEIGFLFIDIIYDNIRKYSYILIIYIFIFFYIYYIL